jgi:hypothetical protein
MVGITLVVLLLGWVTYAHPETSQSGHAGLAATEEQLRTIRHDLGLDRSYIEVVRDDLARDHRWIVLLPLPVLLLAADAYVRNIARRSLDVAIPS